MRHVGYRAEQWRAVSAEARFIAQQRGERSAAHVLERRLAAGMAELRACATPAERAAVEERLRPLAARRKRLVEMARARREAA